MAGIKNPSRGYADAQGDYVREVAAFVKGGRDGPRYTAGNYTVPAPGASDGPPYSDAFLACVGNITVTAPVAAVTPLGTGITVNNAGVGNITFSAPDAVMSTAGNTSSNAVAGTTKRYILADVNGTLTWLVG